MAITDIQISEELETNAPSIKYKGDEGPKSPEEEMMMADAILQEEYEKYVYDLLEQRPDATPMSLDEFRRMVIGDMSGGQPLPQDPTKPVNPFQPKPQGPVLPDRQMAAYGGIMGVDGRRKYGIGSKFKKAVRKLIPNEIAKVAEVAAPFVAPFNPLAAGLMSGIGGFDRTGRIGSSLKSGLINYGLGNIARMAGGAGFQGGLKAPGTGTGFGSYFTSPTTGKQLFGQKIPGLDSNKELANKIANRAAEKQAQATGLFAEGEVGKNLTGNIVDEFVNVQTGGKGLDNLTTKLSPLKKLGNKIMEYVPTSLGQLNPFGENFDIKKAGGAFGIFTLGKKLLGEPEQVVDKIMNRGEGLDLEGIRTEVLEAYRDPSGEKLKALAVKYPYIHQNKDVVNVAQGGRIGFNNGGGIMDLGGMEKDYRNTGGFVDIGEYEKKDDVPARLSVNEFVMTADAVRGMGDGDIDLGAKRMENLMGAMENKKGAQQMFDVSERLSEVV